MKVLIDTNVILDYALIRQPFYDLADSIFALIEQKQIEGYVSASTFSDLINLSYSKARSLFSLFYSLR